MKTLSETSTPDSDQAIYVVGTATYLVTFFLRSMGFAQTDVEIFIIPFIFSALAMVSYLLLKKIVPAKWLFLVFVSLCVVVMLGSWYVNTPKTEDECVLSQIKSARNPAAVSQINRSCYDKFN
ncbi:MAG: hypothetical protein WCJ34_10505 [Alcaligenaceae bacterium]